MIHGSLFFDDEDQAFQAINYFEETTHGETARRRPSAGSSSADRSAGQSRKTRPSCFLL
jgi:hypothetical protein